MNFYYRHLGDYIRDTVSLSMLEDGAYNRLLDAYYVREAPLPAEKEKCYKIARAKTKAEKEAVDTVLQEFFTLDGEVFKKNRCDEEIAKFQEKQPRMVVKKENDKARQQRAREKRQALFNQLSELGIHMPWNTTTNDLQQKFDDTSHGPVTQPVTRDNTATQTPDTRHQTPVLKTSISDALTSNPKTDDAPTKTPAQKLNGYGPIAVELIGLGVKVTSIHPTLQAWVDEGITIGRIREAVAVARQSKPAPEPIPAGYLNTILRDKPKSAKSREPPWWSTDQGIDAKGRELGMRPKGGETYPEYKARINAKLQEAKNGKH